MKVRVRQKSDKRDLTLTSMIDVVFLLLVFFVMTFQIVELEGDFSIHAPITTGGPSTDLPLKLHMRATADGELDSMSLGETELGVDFTALRSKVLEHVSANTPFEGGDCPEIEIDTDYHLRYSYVIQAITAVSGYKSGDKVIKLIEKVKFAKPRR